MWGSMGLCRDLGRVQFNMDDFVRAILKHEEGIWVDSCMELCGGGSVVFGHLPEGTLDLPDSRGLRLRLAL